LRKTGDATVRLTIDHFLVLVHKLTVASQRRLGLGVNQRGVARLKENGPLDIVGSAWHATGLTPKTETRRFSTLCREGNYGCNNGRLFNAIY
jgi:hypothetical protein